MGEICTLKLVGMAQEPTSITDLSTAFGVVRKNLGAYRPSRKYIFGVETQLMYGSGEITRHIGALVPVFHDAGRAHRWSRLVTLSRSGLKTRQSIGGGPKSLEFSGDKIDKILQVSGFADDVPGPLDDWGRYKKFNESNAITARPLMSPLSIIPELPADADGKGVAEKRHLGTSSGCNGPSDKKQRHSWGTSR